MEDVQKDPRLSELSTNWTMLFEANYGTPEQASDALRLLMLRYSGAVHRYLLKTVGNRGRSEGARSGVCPSLPQGEVPELRPEGRPVSGLRQARRSAT